jgi:hypothetical protein
LCRYAERFEKKAAANTFWIFDVGGGDVPSTRKIFAALEVGDCTS